MTDNKFCNQDYEKIAGEYNFSIKELNEEEVLFCHRYSGLFFTVPKTLSNESQAEANISFSLNDKLKPETVVESLEDLIRTRNRLEAAGFQGRFKIDYNTIGRGSVDAEITYGTSIPDLDNLRCRLKNFNDAITEDYMPQIGRIYSLVEHEIFRNKDNLENYCLIADMRIRKFVRFLKDSGWSVTGPNLATSYSIFNNDDSVAGIIYYDKVNVFNSRLEKAVHSYRI